MATIGNPLLANSNYASLMPGRNTGGSSLPAIGDVPGTGSSSGANPILTPPNIPSGAPATNPYAPGSVVPSFGANSGPYSPVSLTGGTATPGAAQGGTTVGAAQNSTIGGMNLMTPTDLGKMFNSLAKTYGDGTAHAIMDFLSTGAGFNQSAINNIFAALQPGFERSQENLMTQFSTSGNRFGSGAQIGMADLLSQENLNMGQIETQMYESSVSDYINTLLSTGKDNASRIATSPSTLSTIGSALPIIGGAADALNSSTGASGAMQGILSTIAGLGGL